MSTTLHQHEGVVNSSEVPSQNSSLAVNGASTTLELFSHASISSKPILRRQLVQLLNEAFTHAHKTGPVRVEPPVVTRVHSTDQLLEEIGDEGFTYVLFAPAETTGPEGTKTKLPIATASGKPIYGENTQLIPDSATVTDSSKPAYKSFKRNWTIAEKDKDIPHFELILMGVSPFAMNQGLASRLMQLVTDEAKRRVGGKEIELRLTTALERNGEFYQKRGYTTLAATWMEKGFANAVVGFTIVEMGKRA